VRVAAVFLLGCGTAGTPADGGTEKIDIVDAAVEAEAEAGPAALFSGTVTVKGTQPGYAIDGRFEAIGSTPFKPNPCSSPYVESGCSYVACMPPSMDAGTPMEISAGTLSIGIGSAMIPTMRDANGVYTATGMTLLFSGGETVHAIASGDPMGAPAFDVSVAAAAGITVTNPTFPVVALPIMQSQPFPIQWNAASPGKVIARLSAQRANKITDVVTCEADAMSGGLVITPVLMAKLNAGAAQLDIVTTTYAQRLFVRDWLIDLETIDVAVDPNGRQLEGVGAVLF
jgi:hypothetical protein